MSFLERYLRSLRDYITQRMMAGLICPPKFEGFGQRPHAQIDFYTVDSETVTVPTHLEGGTIIEIYSVIFISQFSKLRAKYD